MLIGATARATRGEFAINHDGGNASDAVLFRFRSNFGLLDIMDHYRRFDGLLSYDETNICIQSQLEAKEGQAQ